MKTVGPMLALLLVACAYVLNIFAGKAGNEIRHESAGTMDDSAVDELKKTLAEEVRNREKLEESVSKLRKDHDQLLKDHVQAKKDLEAAVAGARKEAREKAGTLEADLAKRYLVETQVIPLGEHAGNGEVNLTHDFDKDVLGVAGFVQDTGGDYSPLIGDCKAHTVGLATQRLGDGKLRVRVTFQPRYNKLPFAFVCIVVKRPS